MKLDVTALPAGTVLLGKYRVIGTIGVGGMGVVIAAEHLSLHTKVAVKFMLPQLVQHDSVVKRFVNEARAAGRIQSEHVARVLDVGSMTGEGLPDDGVPYMVMEFLQGKDLSMHVKAGRRFPVVEAVDYVIQASEALAQAHKEGIIHRDIKPANLFLAEFEGRRVVKVLDFGISKILDEEPQEMNLTKTTTVLGSGLYMSPEQMRSAKSVDFRTDVYSLGVCLYELLTGTQPFTAETFSELVVKVNIDPPTPLKQYRPDISDTFAAVLEKAYARKPQDRYQSIQEMVMALSAFADPGSSTAIRNVQGITLAEGVRSSLVGAAPAGSSGLYAAQTSGAHAAQTSGEHPLVGTAGALTASSAGAAGKSNKGLVLLGAVALVVLGGAAAFFTLGKPQETPASATTVATTAVPTATAESATTAAAATPSATSTEPAAPPSATAASSAEPLASAAPSAFPSGRAVTGGPRINGVGVKTTTGGGAAPPKCVQKRDPVTGLLMPCF